MLTRLGNLETFGEADVSGLMEQISKKLREVETSKSLVAQLQAWAGDLEADFLRSSSFSRFFKDLESPLQQTILMQLGSKLLEALSIL